MTTKELLDAFKKLCPDMSANIEFTDGEIIVNTGYVWPEYEDPPDVPVIKLRDVAWANRLKEANDEKNPV